MATSPTNILQQVTTYNRSGLALLINDSPFIAEICNTKFENFQDIEANLGDTVNFDLPPRGVANNGLVAKFQAQAQRVHTLTCDQAANYAYQFTAQQRLFNADKKNDSYLPTFAKSAVAEIASAVEKNVALTATSAVPVMSVVDGQSVPTGALHTESGPYRFYGNARTSINSFGQLATMIEQFRTFGAGKEEIKIVLPNLAYPTIINSGLGQFALDRNNKMAMSWMVGEFDNAKFYKSNLLPTHYSGNVGNAASGGNILTVISTNDPTGANITQITCSGATASDANAIKSGDMMVFVQNVSNLANLTFRTFIGHSITPLPFQFRVTANAAADGSGHVVLQVLPAICAEAGNANQNVSTNILAGMQIEVMPSHVAGLVVGSSALMLAMPKLPDERPYDTSVAVDDSGLTGASWRTYYGSLFGQNQRGIVFDTIWGVTGVPEYLMRVLFPLSQFV